MGDYSSAPFCLRLMIGNLRALEFCGPAGDHAPQCVPAVGHNQHDVRNHEHYKEHHQPKVPHPGIVKSAEDRGEPGELCRFVNCPSSGDSEESGNCNDKIGEPLEGVVFCPEVGMDWLAPSQYGIR